MQLSRQRWVLPAVWLAVPLLQFAGAAGFLLSHRGDPGSSAVAIVFPPWWSETDTVTAVRAQGLIPSPAGASFIAIVAPGPRTETVSGAWFSLSLPPGLFCSDKENTT